MVIAVISEIIRADARVLEDLDLEFQNRVGAVSESPREIKRTLRRD